MDDTWSSHQVIISQDERSRAADCKDHIAKALWADYIKRPAHTIYLANAWTSEPQINRSISQTASLAISSRLLSLQWDLIDNVGGAVNTLT